MIPNKLLLDIKVFQRVLFLCTFVFLIARSPAPWMTHDAHWYLNSSLQWFGGGVEDDQQLIIRGFLTSIVYLLPSFLDTKLLEPSIFGSFIYALVMIQNAALASWMSVYMLPKFSGLFVQPKRLTITITSVLGVYALKSFVPYSLMDLWAVAFLLSGCYLIYENSIRKLIFAGLALGICFNLRPSYLVTLCLVLGFLLFSKRIAATFVALGFFIAQLPQVVYNWLEFRNLSLVPNGLGKLESLNLALKASSIRFDGIAYPLIPSGETSLSFCDKAMYELMVQDSIDNRLELTKFFLVNLDEFVPFYFKKFAAVFWWPVDVPYFNHNPIVNSVFGAVVLFIFVFGFGNILRMAFRSSSWNNQQLLVSVFVLVGFLANLASYHSEARYSLPLVLLGIVGLAVFCTDLISIDFSEHSFWQLHKRYLLYCSGVYCLLFFIVATNLMGNAGIANLQCPM